MLPYPRALAAALITFLMAGGVAAQDYAIGPIKVSKVWTREVPPASKVAAGYMTITNTGTQPDTLVGGSLAGAGGFQLHQMETVNGQMTMHELKPGVPGSLDPAQGRPGGQRNLDL